MILLFRETGVRSKYLRLSGHVFHGLFLPVGFGPAVVMPVTWTAGRWRK